MEGSMHVSNFSWCIKFERDKVPRVIEWKRVSVDFTVEKLHRIGKLWNSFRNT